MIFDEPPAFRYDRVFPPTGRLQVNERYAIMLKDAGKTARLMEFAEKAICTASRGILIRWIHRFRGSELPLTGEEARLLRDSSSAG